MGYYKNSSGYIDVYYLYKIVKFKFTKKGKYIIVLRDLKGSENFILESCTLSEGGLMILLDYTLILHLK